MKLSLFSISLAAVLLSFAVPNAVFSSEVRSLESPLNSEDVVTQNPTHLTRSRAPTILDQGFEAYRRGGIRGAMDVWLHNSPSYFQRQSMIGADEIAGILQTYGDYTGYSVIHSSSITDNTQVFYIESQHQHGTFFWEFVVSTTGGTSTVTAWRFQSNPTQILPEFLLRRE